MAAQGRRNLEAFSVRLDGRVLCRGFWLYVVDIRGPKGRYLYVGRTGDSSSRHAASPFARLARHLEARPNARSNALARNLKKAKIDAASCQLEMIAVGPIFPEQATFEAHKPFRDRVAALERGVADTLRDRGYQVLGQHGTPSSEGPVDLEQYVAVIEEKLAHG